MHFSVFTFPSFQKTLPMFPWRLSCAFSKTASLFLAPVPALEPRRDDRSSPALPQLSLISLRHGYNVCTAVSPMEAEGRAVSPGSLPDEPSSVSDLQEAFERCLEEGTTRSQ